MEQKKRFFCTTLLFALKIIYLIVFSPKFLLETLEKILETKISVKKLYNIFFYILI